jgi:hypothetical protein
MSQMKLITDSRAEWTVKDLVETLHAKVDDLERKLDAQLTVNASIQWHLNAIILHLAGDRAALTAFVMASEPTVVPNEDEAMPVAEDDETPWPVDTRPILACCPTCGMTAYTEGAVEHAFGYRTPADRETIRQSWCRRCRALEQATSPRKKQRLPDDVRELGMQARDLHKQADAKAEERAKVLAGSKGRETKDSVVLLVDEQDLRTEAVRLLSEYDQKRGILRKAKKAAK